MSEERVEYFFDEEDDDEDEDALYLEFNYKQQKKQWDKEWQ